MDLLARMKKNWELFYTQFRNVSGDQVACMMNRETRKFIYLDLKLNRVLSKQEADLFRIDKTGWNLPYKE